MSQNYGDFKITQSGIYNNDTGTFLTFDRFMTKKGQWSVALKKRLGMMDNTDLNKFTNVYSKVYTLDKKVVSDELYNIVPNFNNQKTTIYVDGKFYKARTKKNLLSEFHLADNNRWEKNPTSVANKNSFIEDLKKLNLGTLLEVKVNLTEVNFKTIFQQIKNNIIDKKVIASMGSNWLPINEKMMKRFLTHNAEYITTGVGSDVFPELVNLGGEMTIKIVDYSETYSNSNQPMGMVGNI